MVLHRPRYDFFQMSTARNLGSDSRVQVIVANERLQQIVSFPTDYRALSVGPPFQ
jgi:hypothetical protein